VWQAQSDVIQILAAGAMVTVLDLLFFFAIFAFFITMRKNKFSRRKLKSAQKCSTQKFTPLAKLYIQTSHVESWWHLFPAPFNNMRTLKFKA